MISIASPARKCAIFRAKARKSRFAIFREIAIAIAEKIAEYDAEFF
jgi:hypothetical protein